jgi:guanylate kinase
MIILCGPSASGKTEVAKVLQEKFQIKKVITNTTREKRINEINDVDYHFLSVEQFLKLKDEDYFVETTFYNGNYYGCAKNEIGLDKVIILEPEGVNNFLKLNDPNIIIFFLTSSKDVREERMRLRGDDEQIIKQRLSDDEQRFSEKNTSFATFTLDSDDLSINQLADKIFYQYLNKLKQE